MSIQPFTTSDGVPLHVVEEGPEQGATVVLLHGWTQSLHTWDRVAELLPARAGVPLRLVRFDFRGHGRSGRAPGTATIDRCADDLLELLHARARSGPLVLAGHSMGGMTIMALAERHPELFEERVRAVALVATSHGGLERATSGSPTPWAKLAKRALRTTRLTPHDVPAVLLRQGLRRLLFGKHPRAADVSQVTRELKACDAVAYREFLSSLKKHDRGAALAHLATIPAVLLSGTADRMTPHRHTRRMGALLPHARLAAYPDAGHMLPLERRGEVTEHIARLVWAASDREVTCGPDAERSRTRSHRTTTPEVVGEKQF